MKLRNEHTGFTVVEFLVFIFILSVAAFFGLTSYRATRAENRDSERKSDINAIVFQLESRYEKNNYYPSTADKKSLPDVDEANLADPFGKKIGEMGSQYNYRAFGCNESKCTSFEISASMEREDTYRVSSLNR